MKITENLSHASVSEGVTYRWEEAVPETGKNGFPQVFCGMSHALILRPNGDLYAIGNNRNGCCGENLPEELLKFTRIARGVTHAAAGKDHTLYVSENGKVTILGHSEYTERFRCDFPVKHVYAHPDECAFLLENEAGDFYFFGDRSPVNLIKGTSEIVRTLHGPTTKKIYYYENNFNGHTYTLSYHTSIEHGHACVTDCTGLHEIQNSEWYRQLIRDHGEDNVSVTVRSVPDETGFLPPSWGRGEAVFEYCSEYMVQVVNLKIYTPCFCGRYDTHIADPNCFYGCWPDIFCNETLTSWVPPTTLAKARKIINNRRVYSDPPRYMKAMISEDGLLEISISDTDEYETRINISGIADCAIMTSGLSILKDMVLLVTADCAVYRGRLEEMKEAAKKPTGLFPQFQKRPSAMSFMRRIVFSAEP